MSSQLLQEISLSLAGGDEYTRVTVSPGGPLYWCSNDEVWYIKAILCKNAMRKFFSTVVKNPGLQLEGNRATNPSVRKTCISRLLDADILENYPAGATEGEFGKRVYNLTSQQV